jgi:predicted lysophospholipase L1 biosynthesis ABC-type transport system permease subunit
MRELGKRIGDRLDADLEAGPTLHLRIVGRMVLNAGPLDHAITPGKGGVVDFEMLRRIYSEVCPLVYLVGLDPAADRSQAVDAFRRTFPGTVVEQAHHPDIQNLSRVEYLPGLLATVMAVLALSTLIHTLASSIRRRRRGLAILKTLGLLPRQISTTVAWQATTVATAAVLAGIPLGVAAGRWTWQLVAVQLGVLYEPVLPLQQVLIIAAGTFVAAILVAVGPAWVAGHIPPATVLRSE